MDSSSGMVLTRRASGYTPLQPERAHVPIKSTGNVFQTDCEYSERAQGKRYVFLIWNWIFIRRKGKGWIAKTSFTEKLFTT